jgi:hypothetical protein
MTQTKRRLAVTAALAIFLLATAAISNAGRTAISRGLSFLSGRADTAPENASALTEVVLQSDEDLERRARARHHWTIAILNSVVRGAITFYSGDGAVTGQANLTIYRAYPGRLRVELDRGGSVETVGFDGVSAWREGAPTLNEQRARDIRTWLRAWPERLFTTRAAGATYREAGPRVELSKPGRPWQGPTSIVPPISYEQIAMEDILGLPPGPGRVGDRRFVLYYVNRNTSTVESARWLEPDNPQQAVTNSSVQMKDVRVDFSDWQTVEGILWPFDISHWLGGKVDYRITVTQVQMNQPLADSIFQGP